MTYARAIGWLTGGIAAAMSAYHIWTTAFGPPEALFFRGTHLIFALALVFLSNPLRRRPTPGHRGLDPRAAGRRLGRAPVPHLRPGGEPDHLHRRPHPGRHALGLALCRARARGDAARRRLGAAGDGACLPRPRRDGPRSQPLPILLDQLYLTTEGIFGSTLGVSAGFVVVFVLFGAFMERSGVGRLFMEFSLALTGRSVGGPAKVAVVSSSLFGSVSGSAVANVMVTGQVTIPLMIRTGFRPAFAAAVEAVASTGGQIMPPIMGAAAFVMAEFLQVQYLQVIAWALLPAILFYVAAFAAVHFEARRSGLVRACARGGAAACARRRRTGPSRDPDRDRAGGALPRLLRPPVRPRRHGGMFSRRGFASLLAGNGDARQRLAAR
ncbi:MAG: TRAP transporter large permease subunit [Acetobacteraceae bacterium]|nr:TRAP transporter large permease subunit [Acetobacteraceae bacterium]